MQSDEIIITAPSLDVHDNVSGVSEVVRFIISNNPRHRYIHFCVGRKDCEASNLLYGLWRFIKTYEQWKELLRDNKDSIIHYSYPLDGKSILRDYFIMGYAVKHHRKMLIHVHGGLYLTKEKCPWIIKHLLKKVFSWHCPIVVLSDKEKTLLTNKFKANDVEVLPNCVPLTDAIHYEKHIKDKTKLDLLYIGRIEKNKGVDEIIRACQELMKSNTPFLLHIAGKEQTAGEYLPKINCLLGENVIYEGVVTGNTKTQLFKTCDVFLLPSYYEGLPMGLLESMSFGLIPICTDVGSIATVLEDGVNGYFVSMRNHAEIVRCVEQICVDRDKAEVMSAKAKQKILDNFSTHSYIERLNSIYEHIS